MESGNNEMNSKSTVKIPYANIELEGNLEIPESAKGIIIKYAKAAPP